MIWIEIPCSLVYKPMKKRYKSRIWGDKSEGDMKDMNKKWLVTGEAIVVGQWGAGENQSKGERRVVNGRGGSGENG